MNKARVAEAARGLFQIDQTMRPEFILKPSYRVDCLARVPQGIGVKPQ